MFVYKTPSQYLKINLYWWDYDNMTSFYKWKKFVIIKLLHLDVSDFKTSKSNIKYHLIGLIKKKLWKNKIKSYK